MFRLPKAYSAETAAGHIRKGAFVDPLHPRQLHGESYQSIKPARLQTAAV